MRAGPHTDMQAALRVLVCEDEKIVARDYVKQLETAGYVVVAQAHTGAEAVEKTRDAKPDVVLMDIQLPDMDGLAACEAICKERAVPIVMVTGHTEPEFLERAKAVGAFGYIVKPVSQGALRPAIETAVARFTEAQELKGEVAGLQESLNGRKVIERAKGLLMQRAGLPEEQAYLTLQKAARNQNVKLAELAKRFIEAGDAWSSVLAPKGRPTRPS